MVGLAFEFLFGLHFTSTYYSLIFLFPGGLLIVLHLVRAMSNSLISSSPINVDPFITNTKNLYAHCLFLHLICNMHTLNSAVHGYCMFLLSCNCHWYVTVHVGLGKEFLNILHSIRLPSTPGYIYIFLFATIFRLMLLSELIAVTEPMFFCVRSGSGLPCLHVLHYAKIYLGCSVYLQYLHLFPCCLFCDFCLHSTPWFCIFVSFWYFHTMYNYCLKGKLCYNP